MKMPRLGFAVLFCVFVAALNVDDVYGDFLDNIRSQLVRFGDQAADSLGVLISNIDHHGKAYGGIISHGYNGNVEPQIKTWFEKHRETIAPENQPAPVGATTCVGLPDDPSLILDCHFEGESVNCSTPAQVGTVANMGCSGGYLATHRHGYNSITCNGSFVWNKRLLHCIPDCGRQNAVGGREFISNGEEVQVGEFAWHVGIYQVNESQLYSQICGGSLITPAYVLTAAHCFWDLSAKKVKPKELFSIGAGKYNIDWYVDDREVQRRNLSGIHLGPRFAGDRHFLAYDIALVRLDKDIQLTPLVNIICVDFDNTFEPLHMIPGANGTMAGWGITEHNEPSEVLKSVRLPYIPVEECENIVEVKFQKYLTHDKFCAGYVNKATSICPGDSGGGYAFPQPTRDGTRFYLHGIASVGHRARSNTGLKCQTEQVAAFTRVSLYMRWIEQIVVG